MCCTGLVTQLRQAELITGNIMENLLPENYKGWTIKIYNEGEMCANYSFDIISPTGNVQHVSMGGKDSEMARKRAKEMIDMEITFADEG